MYIHFTKIRHETLLRHQRWHVHPFYKGKTGDVTKTSEMAYLCRMDVHAISDALVTSPALPL
jgi:ribosomal protein L21E